jgi:acyl-CoA reductase-like NAD-dependent aldehyde dehydrogenase
MCSSSFDSESLASKYLGVKLSIGHRCPDSSPRLANQVACRGRGPAVHGRTCIAERTTVRIAHGTVSFRSFGAFFALPVGDRRGASTAIGPLINRAAVERVSALVQDAVGKEAKALSDGEADGSCYEATVLTGVTPEMRVYEESFGPLVTVVPVNGPDAAVDVANDTDYGLSAAVFSEDVPAALELAQRIESGICHVSDTTVHDEPQMPFGGAKASGFGRFGGRVVLEAD